MTAPKPKQQLDLAEPPRADITMVNGRCVIHEQEGICVVVVAGIPVQRFTHEDLFSRNLFVAQAMDAKWATGPEIASALGVSLSTIDRTRRGWLKDGVEGLVPKKTGRPYGQSLVETEQQAIRKWHGQGVSGREIARRLKRVQFRVGRRFRSDSKDLRDVARSAAA